MAELVANCPRCGAKSITHDVTALNLVLPKTSFRMRQYEAFGVCRQCKQGTIFVIDEEHDDPDLFDRQSPLQVKGVLNDYFNARRFIGLKDQATSLPPEHVPPDIADVFREAATCLRMECWNAAGTMFRLCVDLATRPMLPAKDVEGLNAKTRRDLGLRLPWLFANGILSADLCELSTAIREDANDGAHQGTLTKEEAHNLLDFTTALLERIFTEPKKIELAKERRQQRRARAHEK
jgi:hypothetical protein